MRNVQTPVKNTSNSKRGPVVWILKSRIGHLIARPWLDRCILAALEYVFFPLSRLWAASRAAEGTVDGFIEATPLGPPGKWRRGIIERALHNFERKRLRAFSTEQLWHLYYFGEEEVAAERLPIVEEMRLDNRTSYNLSRRSFIPLIPLVKTSVRMFPPTPEEVEEAYGSQGERLEDLFALPDVLPNIQVSRPLPTHYGKDFWLRFPSPSSRMNDEVYARVHEPHDVENPPTLIFGHGICVEFDHYRQLLDEITALTDMGVRVIRPEAPWHGRRVLPGHFGGEQLLSALPISMIEFVAAQHREWATLINWCKSNSSGEVAIGGSSLGAQSAKAIAMRASNWPEHLQPSALLCVTHSAHIYEAALDGELSDIWNLGRAMSGQGWHRDSERLWLKRLDPDGLPCMDGSRIISVTGSRDTITSEQSALEHMAQWQVPQENIFSYKRGHFTVPLGMLGDREPLERFAQILLSKPDTPCRN